MSEGGNEQSRMSEWHVAPLPRVLGQRSVIALAITASGAALVGAFALLRESVALGGAAGCFLVITALLAYGGFAVCVRVRTGERGLEGITVLGRRRALTWGEVGKVTGRGGGAGKAADSLGVMARRRPWRHMTIPMSTEGFLDVALTIRAQAPSARWDFAARAWARRQGIDLS